MTNNLAYFKYYGNVVVFISALLHNVLFFSLNSFFITATIVYGWILILFFVLSEYNLKNYTVSTIMISGWLLIHFLFPMPVMLIEGKSMDFNLRLPIETFLHQAIFVTTIVVTHSFYAFIFNKKTPLKNFLIKTGFYFQPSNLFIWCTSVIGAFFMAYNFFIFGALGADVSDRGLLFYIGNIFSQYVWMPVLILLPHFRFGVSGEDKKNYPYVFIYIAIIFLIAISSNMRTLVFGGFVTVVSLVFVGFLLGFYDFKSLFGLRKVIIYVISIFFFGGAVVDLGYAMVAVRGDRNAMSASELISETLKIYNDKNLLKEVKQASKVGDDVFDVKTFKWDEDYIDNIIVNRYINFKISDNSIFYAKEIGFGNSYVQEEFYSQIAALFPNVMLKLIDYDVSKKNDTASYSIGDYVYSVAVNNQSVLGSFVISSMPGIGLAIFGYWYPVIVFALFVPIFFMFDSFVLRLNDKFYFSYYFFASIVLILNYFNDRHVYTFEFRYIFRTYLESVGTFLLVVVLFGWILGKKINRQFQ